MAERLLGQETEYGLSVMRKAGATGENEHAAEELLNLATMFPHLPAMRSSGIFLANGSRFYVDCGAHPELATPECTNPWDVVRYIRAGEHLLLDLAEQLRKRDPRIARAIILKGNVDYATRATWGCHESYLHQIRDRAFLSRQIIPHLVSRVAFTGAGGFDSLSPGLDFMVSPRVAYLQKSVAGESTNGRGTFHTKDEPLCGDGYHRTFATDPSCSRPVKLTDGREMTALEIQSHFLAVAEMHAGAEFMPPWAGEVCRQWRAMLGRLRQLPALAGRTLDWAIKLALFENHARRRNTTLHALAKWSPVLGKLSGVRSENGGGDIPLTADIILSRRSPFAAARKALAPMLEEHHLQWEGLADFLKVRLELLELDTRFGLLGEGGLFTALDAARGALDHRFPGVDNIPHARENPPASGRAAVRGACIRRVAGQNGRFAAEWDGVWDLEAGTALNLCDPFCTSETWEQSRTPAREPANPEHLFRVGRYAEMLDEENLRTTLRFSPESTVLAFARVGRRDEAFEWLGTIPPNITECHTVALGLSVFSNGLVPAVREMELLIPKAERLIDEEPDAWNAYSRFVFRSYKALCFLHKGLYQLAEPFFVSLVADESHTARSRMCARNRCHLAELYRRLGRPEEARNLASTAAGTHDREHLSGDRAAHSLPMQAKLTPDAEEAGLLLKLAEITHTSYGNNLGLAHILCLRARRLQDGSILERVMALQQSIPVLRNCDVARRIVREWDAWIAPPGGDDPVDYWGL